MKTLLISIIATVALFLATGDSEAARRFGGGGNLGKQRAAPTQNTATPAPAGTPASTPSTPTASPAAAGGAAAAAAKPSFMQRWGGMLAGLAIGGLLASMFGASMGPIIGMLLMGLAIAAVGFLLFRLFASKSAGPQHAVSPSQAGAQFSREEPQQRSPGFSGIGSNVEGASAPVTAPAAVSPAVAKPNIDTEPFLRVAKTSFIRLQAANDSGDLDDIRDYTTPEVYAEIAMQVKERGATPQRTEVVSLNAELIETAVEGEYDIASVRFYGLLREDNAANPEPFDETWHVRKDRRERNGAWLIAGIQQAA